MLAGAALEPRTEPGKGADLRPSGGDTGEAREDLQAGGTLEWIGRRTLNRRTDLVQLKAAGGGQ
jgi:hypothetical protein